MEQGMGWAKPAKYTAKTLNNGHWTEGDDSHGAGVASALCRHCSLTMLRPPVLPPEKPQINAAPLPTAA